MLRLLFVLCFFTRTRSKTQQLRILRSWQSNSLQNVVFFSHQGQKTVSEDEF